MLNNNQNKKFFNFMFKNKKTSNKIKLMKKIKKNKIIYFNNKK